MSWFATGLHAQLVTCAHRPPPFTSPPAAMLGFLIAIGTELASNQSVWSQVGGAERWGCAGRRRRRLCSEAGHPRKALARSTRPPATLPAPPHRRLQIAGKYVDRELVEQPIGMSTLYYGFVVVMLVSLRPARLPWGHAGPSLARLPIPSLTPAPCPLPAPARRRTPASCRGCRAWSPRTASLAPSPPPQSWPTAAPPCEPSRPHAPLLLALCAAAAGTHALALALGRARPANAPAPRPPPHSCSTRLLAHIQTHPAPARTLPTPPPPQAGLPGAAGRGVLPRQRGAVLSPCPRPAALPTAPHASLNHV